MSLMENLSIVLIAQWQKAWTLSTRNEELVKISTSMVLFALASNSLTPGPMLVVALKDEESVDTAKMAEMLRASIQMRCEVQPNDVRFEPLDALIRRIGLETEMKEKRIVDLRPRR